MHEKAKGKALCTGIAQEKCGKDTVRPLSLDFGSSGVNSIFLLNGNGYTTKTSDLS